MKSIGLSIARDQATDTLKGIKNNIPGKQQINWNDFNYPPLIKVFHYNASELEPPVRNKVRLMWLTHIIVVVVTLLNLISNIAQVAALSGIGLRILYAFVFIIIFNPY